MDPPFLNERLVQFSDEKLILCCFKVIFHSYKLCAQVINTCSILTLLVLLDKRFICLSNTLEFSNQFNMFSCSQDQNKNVVNRGKVKGAKWNAFHFAPVCFTLPQTV